MYSKLDKVSLKKNIKWVIEQLLFRNVLISILKLSCILINLLNLLNYYVTNVGLFPFRLNIIVTSD